MNFKIYDDEFDEYKQEYINEIIGLQQNAITKEYENDWNEFVKKVLVDTRSYYILVFSLKVMINMNNRNLYPMLNDVDFYNQCIINAMTFMPDKTFLETVIMIVSKFHSKGSVLARIQGVDVSDLIEKAKVLAKKQIEKNKKNKFDDK